MAPVKHGAAFTPLNLSNLKFFIDPSNSSKVTLSGSNITQVVDSSTNAFVFAQATGASQPTIVTADLNGNNTMSFDGTNDFLSCNIGSDLTTVSLFIIARASTFGVFKVFVSTDAVTTNAINLEEGVTSQLDMWVDNAIGNPFAATGLGTFSTATWYKIALTYQSGAGKIYIDDLVTAKGTTTQASAFLRANKCTIGWDGGAGFNAFAGKMATIIAVNGIFSAGDMSNLTAWSLSKYGI